MLVGKVQQVGLRRSGGRATIAVRIATSDAEGGSGEQREVEWDSISKIGDIILLSGGSKTAGGPASTAAATCKCPSCGYQNEAGALYCEECGTRL
ncbi:MAG: hypothetical protein C4292_04800, partial [Nitrososphaera sp.]